MSEDAGIEPRTVATTAVRRPNHSARSHRQALWRILSISLTSFGAQSVPAKCHKKTGKSGKPHASCGFVRGGSSPPPPPSSYVFAKLD